LNAVLAVLPGPAEVVLLGNPEGNTEHVISYELGYRTQPSARLSFDLAAFFNNYGGLETIEPLPSFTVPKFQPTLARSAPLDRGQNARHDGRHRGNSELERNQPLERQPWVCAFEDASAYRGFEP